MTPVEDLVGLCLDARCPTWFAAVSTADPDWAPVYEAGCVLVVEGGLAALAPLAPGLADLVRRVDPPAPTDLGVQKLKMPRLLAPLPAAGVAGHALAPFFRDRAAAAAFQPAAADATAKARAATAAKFPGYRVVGGDSTWRLTRTVDEAFHYDYYGDGPNDGHHVRLFANLDDRPRLWGVGPPIDAAVAAYPEAARAALGTSRPVPNAFAKAFTEALDWPAVPRHYVAFPPGAAWLVDSRTVAHAVLFGRKMLACTLDVDPASAADPALLFPARVAAALRGVAR